ncbi:protein halfway isoform X2 [Periplaneta americana]|uniref:protein halfway isoform X2 n=1 Tax=Periplaneta americana TaxID=6978 RepID=UPI0037E74B9B
MELILTALLALAATPVSSSQSSECFQGPKDYCKDSTEESGCRYLSDANDTALCCHLKSFAFKEWISVLQTNRNLSKLYIHFTILDELNMNMFWSPTLKSLTFTDGQAPRVVRANKTTLTSLKCLNLSSNQIVDFDSRVTADLPSLELLDLSNNNLTNFSLIKAENSNRSLPQFWLDISNNKKVWCANITRLRSRKHGTGDLDFLNKNNTACTVLREEYWFPVVSTLTFHQLDQLDKVDEQCRKDTPCTCQVIRYLILEDQSLSLHISANCSGKNLTALPDVPAHTVSLNISNNNITSLKRFKTDANYSEIKELYAENNQIMSLQEIEASEFLKHFQILDIRGNKLTEIETYIYNNAFDGDNHKIVRLAGNKVLCDCNTALHVKVKDLDQNKVCKHQRVWTDYINYIIACEVVLLLLLVSKVSYDYWVFRTAGYLPWPASKMPKMPCDWVFET